MAAARTFTLLLLLTACAGVCVNAAVSEEPYSPNQRVKDYHKYTFETEADYFVKVGQYRAGPWVVLGIIFFFVFIFWSFGRLCCRGCCGCRQPRTLNRKKRLTYFIIGFVMACACGALLFYGLAAEKRQSDAMEDVPGLIDNVIAWKNDAVTQINNVTLILNDTLSVANNVTASIRSANEATYVSFNNSIAEAKSKIQEIVDQINDVDLENIKKDFGDKVDGYNRDRNQAVTGTLAVLIGVLFLRLLMMFLNGHGPTWARPSKSIPCKLLSHLLTILIVFLILLTWIIAGLLLYTSTVSADFCVDPDNHILDIADLKDDKYAQFFLRCDETNAVNPITNSSIVNPLFSSINDARNEINSVKTQLDLSCPNSTAGCAEAKDNVQYVNNTLTSLNSSLGVDNNLDTNFDSGLLSLASCKSLNGKYQAVLNVICGSFFDALTKFFETFAAFACLFVLLEILKRRYPSELDDDDADDDQDRSAYIPGASAEMSKYDVNKDTEMNFYPSPPYQYPPDEKGGNDGDANAAMYPDQSAGMYPDQNGGMYPDQSAGMYPDSNIYADDGKQPMYPALK